MNKLKALFEVPKTLIERSINNRYLHIDEDEVMERVNFEPSEVEPHVPGDKGITDHTFIVYDHRTEGEIHINNVIFICRLGKTKIIMHTVIRWEMVRWRARYMACLPLKILITLMAAPVLYTKR